MRTNDLLNDNTCTGCFACSAICPKGAIKQTCKKGCYYPVIDEYLCVNCGLCSKVCEGAKKNPLFGARNYIGLYCGSDEIRKESTSGGAFSMIAMRYLQSDGVVYGAAFSEDFSVKHIRCTDYNTLQRIRKSKYVQSDVSDVYEQITGDLLSGKDVLFSGMACQCSGLKSYLQTKGIDDTGVLYIDLICHGVPSPVIWKEYINYRAEERHKNIKNIVFRDKTKSWKDFKLLVEYEDGKIRTFRQNEDYWLVLFFHNLILRESCYTCRYARAERVGDITLGDYWGVWEFSPEMYDDNGTSMILVNTEKGKAYVDGILESAKYVYLNKEQAIKHQNNLKHPSAKDKRSDGFWADYSEKGMEYCLKRYADATFFGKIKRRYIYSFLYKIGVYDLLLKLRG